MPKIRRAGYTFVAWKGDHAPRHVHVFRNGEFVVKWDLENSQVMEGVAPARVQREIKKLVDEGLL